MKTKLLLLLLLAFNYSNAQVTDGLIQYFNFNGSMTSVSGTAVFNYSGNSYGTDRFGNLSSAYSSSWNYVPYATISGLPTGTSSRSISMWVKPEIVNSDNVLFSYGTNSGNAAYGGSFNATNMYQFSYSSNLAFQTSTSIGVWKHVVMTFETGGAAKIYVNGALVASGNYPAWNTGASTAFYLGSLFGSTSSFNGLIDDLRIYNRAINAAEALELYDGTPSYVTQLVREFKFNNSYADETAISSFYDNGFNNFVADRNSNPNGALRINARGTKATINNLPNNTSQRSVSIWYKVASASSDNVLFVYGSANGQQAYGASFNNTNTWYNFSYLTNTSATNPSNDGQWHHLVTTFDQSKNSKIYVDGVLLIQQTQTDWNTNASATNFDFWLGGLFSENSSPFNGSVDDLKIYNYALSQTEVTNLYTNNMLTSENFNASNVDVKLYPNPVNDVLNIETVLDLKSVEIFNIQGQKVLETNQNQINVSSLSSGMYMVTIQDVENNTVTKKVIIK